MQLKLISRKVPYRGRVFTVVVDDVEYPNGTPTVREVASHIGGAVILAAFPDGNIILVNQHRYPMDADLWELPAGKLNVSADGTPEDPLLCAQRELEEETGYLAGRWEKITAIYPSPGFCSEYLHLYLATGLKPAPGGRKLEEGEESMIMRILPFQEAVGMAERGEIVDAKTICALFLGGKLLDRTP
jgi:ADP-ribose pyrophosphatase